MLQSKIDYRAVIAFKVCAHLGNYLADHSEYSREHLVRSGVYSEYARSDD